MRRVSDYVKMSLAVLLVLTFSIYCSMRLLKVQVVESESYNHHEVVVTEYTQKIPSTRGEIVDASGTPDEVASAVLSAVLPLL
jgi:cell division protein FtsI/penicillin-binding protein 2